MYIPHGTHNIFLGVGHLSSFVVFSITIKCEMAVPGTQVLWWGNSKQGVHSRKSCLSWRQDWRGRFVCFSFWDILKLHRNADQQMECRWSRCDMIHHLNVITFLEDYLSFYTEKKPPNPKNPTSVISLWFLTLRDLISVGYSIVPVLWARMWYMEIIAMSSYMRAELLLWDLGADMVNFPGVEAAKWV